jgi:hypothetical protein
MIPDKPKSLIRALWTYLQRNRFTFFFASLLLTIGGGELLVELQMSWGLDLLILLNLLLLFTFVRGRVNVRVGLILFVLFFVSSWFSEISVFRYLSFGSQAYGVALLIMGTLTCFRAAFLGGRTVDHERIYASLSLYLVLGLIFTLLFALIEKILPASFHYETFTAGEPGNKTLSQLMYFSYVTLATLGYGDITPVSGPARGLAILEALIGQLYLVLVVARLVSLYSQSESE